MAKLDHEKANRLGNVQKDRVESSAIEGPIAQQCKLCKKYATEVKKYLRAKKTKTHTKKPKKRRNRRRQQSQHNANRIALCPDCAETYRSRGLLQIGVPANSIKPNRTRKRAL